MFLVTAEQAVSQSQVARAILEVLVLPSSTLVMQNWGSTFLRQLYKNRVLLDLVVRKGASALMIVSERTHDKQLTLDAVQLLSSVIVNARNLRPLLDSNLVQFTVEGLQKWFEERDVASGLLHILAWTVHHMLNSRGGELALGNTPEWELLTGKGITLTKLTRLRGVVPEAEDIFAQMVGSMVLTPLPIQAPLLGNLHMDNSLLSASLAPFLFPHLTENTPGALQALHSLSRLLVCLDEQVSHGLTHSTPFPSTTSSLPIHACCVCI